MNRREVGKGLAAGLATLRLGDAREARALSPAGIRATAKWERVCPGVWRATLGQPEAFTPVGLRSVPPLEQPLRTLPTVTDPPLAVPEANATPRGFLLSLPLAGGEGLYGFGLQFFSFNQRTEKRIIRVNADPKGDSGDSHAPVPFFVSTQGYGVLVDTLRQASFFCGDTHPKPKQPINPDSAKLNTPAQTREREQQTAGQILVEIPRAAGASVYLFAGPTMLQAVQRYNLFAGGGVLPPEWGLGFWYRPEMHSDHAAAIALAREFRNRDIPCDVLGLEPGWQTHAYSCTFAWNTERFPDPKQFLREAAALDYRVNLWEHAFTHPSSPIFEPLVSHAGDFAVWDGLVPDFAGEPARRIFGRYHGRQLIDAGVSGFKLDECDSSDYTGGWSFPEMSQFPSGLDGEQMHATFGLRYQDAIWQPFRERTLPTYNLVRSSGALAAPYPFVLYSDLYDHRQFIRALVNSGFSGLLWCPEVRDAASEEDLIRRLQSVIFSPLAMVNAWYIKNPPWKQLDRARNNQGRLAPDWEALEARCREMIGWRMRLVPYLRSAFGLYAADGTPPFRALLLDYPNAIELREVDDQYMMGDRIMVAPLFAGEPSRNVALPAGEWFDLWTGQSVGGGRSFEVPASTRNIPAYVKAGSVLPLAAVGASSESAESRELTVHVFGDGRVPFTLIGPAGAELELSWNAVSHTGQIKGASSTDRPYRVVAWTEHAGTAASEVFPTTRFVPGASTL